MAWFKRKKSTGLSPDQYANTLIDAFVQKGCERDYVSEGLFGLEYPYSPQIAHIVFVYRAASVSYAVARMAASKLAYRPLAAALKDVVETSDSSSDVVGAVGFVIDLMSREGSLPVLKAQEILKEAGEDIENPGQLAAFCEHFIEVVTLCIEALGEAGPPAD